MSAEEPEDLKSVISVDEEIDDSSYNSEFPERSKILTRSKSSRGKQAAQRKTRSEFSATRNASCGKRSLNRPLMTWSIKEKRCLLEGMKNYGPQNTKLIATLIGSKSEAEVQEKVSRLRVSAQCDVQNVDGATNEEKAPIEKWIHCVGELINGDDTDWSQTITKVLGYIAKHENYKESTIPDLSWKNIYMFLYKLADNETLSLPKLSDIESLILLELLSDLGKTLKRSSTSCQRQILEHKIQMINAGSRQPNANRAQRAHCTKLVAQALANDFTDLEDLLVDSLPKPVSLLNPSASKSSNDIYEAEDLESTKEDTFIPTTSSSSTSHGFCSNGNSQKGSIPASFQHNQIENQSKLVPKEEVDLSQHVVLRNAVGLKQTFIKPKYYTLNPLCIPTKLLDFHPNV